MPEAPVETSPPALPVDTIVVAVQSASKWKSKTLWVAVIGELLTLLSAPELTRLFGGEHATQIIGTISFALMVVLRLITFAPLTGTPGATAAVEAHPAALAASVQAPTPTMVEVPDSGAPLIPPAAPPQQG